LCPLTVAGAAIEEEEVSWDEDDSDEEEEDDDEDDDENKVPTTKQPVAKASTDTLQPATKPKTSTDRASQPDSEASYDVVSGAPSKTPSQSAGSPSGSKVCFSLLPHISQVPSI
jgi:hypothetical protein